MNQNQKVSKTVAVVVLTIPAQKEEGAGIEKPLESKARPERYLNVLTSLKYQTKCQPIGTRMSFC